jgi:hypothetical protein
VIQAEKVAVKTKELWTIVLLEQPSKSTTKATKEKINSSVRKRNLFTQNAEGIPTLCTIMKWCFMGISVMCND